MPAMSSFASAPDARPRLARRSFAGPSSPRGARVPRRRSPLARASSPVPTSPADSPTSDEPPSPRASDVRVRVLRSEDDIPRIVTLCAAVFKEVAVPMPEGADDLLEDVAAFLESRYEQAMIKDLTSVITRNQREKRRAANQAHAEHGRIRARATARELQALQRTRTSVDALTTEQLVDMRARISDEIELAMEQDAKLAGAEYVKRVRARQWMQLVADARVPGGVKTGLVSVPDAAATTRKPNAKFRSVAEAAEARRDRVPEEAGDDRVVPRSVVSSATLQVCVPDAPLPPPFPSARPYRAYLANVAVAPEARRAGVATAVIARAERISKLWGFEEMWLHVNIDNPGARKLYEGLGYERVGEDPWWYLDRRYLMRKTIA